MTLSGHHMTLSGFNHEVLIEDNKSHVTLFTKHRVHVIFIEKGKTQMSFPDFGTCDNTLHCFFTIAAMRPK